MESCNTLREDPLKETDARTFHEHSDVRPSSPKGVLLRLLDFPVNRRSRPLEKFSQGIKPTHCLFPGLRFMDDRS